jgi:hypothetical protein
MERYWCPAFERGWISRRSAGVVGGLTLGISVVLLWAPTAQADVGVEQVSRSSSPAGAEVIVTLGCGFCYPPCIGPKGHRHPAGYPHGTCMLDTKADPPESFPLSLAPLEKTPKPHACGPNALCAPQVLHPPRQAPFTALGSAVPPPGGNDPESGNVPRYLLRFDVPSLRPGTYSFVIYCGSCTKGKGGSLIPSGQLRITPQSVPRSSSSVLPLIID